MDLISGHGATAGWPTHALTPQQRHELIIRADTIRGMMLDRDPNPRHDPPRVTRIGSPELAARFDPIEETIPRVAALLLGLDWADAKWLFGAGIPTDLVLCISPFAADWLVADRSDEATIDRWVNLLTDAFHNQPSADDIQADRDEWQAWNSALEIVAHRPWLVVSWIAFPGERGHLVVHDGAFGAALHFDDPEGPTLGGAAVESSSLDWDDLSTLAHATTGADESFVNWVEIWGSPTPEPTQTDRNAVLAALRASLSGANLEANDGFLWRARPAEFASTDGHSAYDLVEVFPTARAAIELYADMLVAEFNGAEQLGSVAYWHEPLWVVHRGDLPVLLFDEAGQVHMPSSEWLEQAQGRVMLGTPTGDSGDPWAATVFDIPQLLTAAERWSDRWLAPASAVLGDLLRSGAGSVRGYLVDEEADG